MSGQLLTVSQLNEYIKMLMDGNPLLGDVFVRGEISNFTNHYKTGHFYFSLKDESALLRAVMFRMNASRLRFLPENGMKVILHGRISVFPRDGQYQIYVDDMQPDGVGALYLAYEQLRQKLEAEGLFDAAAKKPLPRFPRRIGIITSPTGAAVRDMLQILGRRFPAAEIFLYPALVQGSDAPASLMAGVDCFENKFPVDVILIGRGGGSAEDLFAFNHEGLARAIAACQTPVVSAVGHETDFTICDFVADLRAPTPSAAAELAVPDTAELKSSLSALGARLHGDADKLLVSARACVSELAHSDALRSPSYYIEEQRMATVFLAERAESAFSKQLSNTSGELRALCAKLDTLSPLRVLSRGYAAVFDTNGVPIAQGRDLERGTPIRVRFADSTVDATVCGVRESE